MLVYRARRHGVISLLAASLLLNAGCTSTGSKPATDANENTSNTPSFEEVDLLTSSEDSKPAPIITESLVPAQFSDIPIEMNESVQRWIYYFTQRDPERFRMYTKRGARYRKMIEQILAEHGVPKEIYYLALIESGFSTAATSHASAVGVWQFIKPTGARYGMQINSMIDERRDPELATHAAAQYLSDLYRVYHSWYLALASYNAGESRIMNAVMRANTRDFWELARQRALPKETMNYVPKFIAAVMVGTDPEKYGFAHETDTSWHDVVSIKVPSYVPLKDIANQAGIDAQELVELNPAFKQKTTYYSQGAANLRIHSSDRSKVETILAQLKPNSRIRPTEIAEKKGRKSAPVISRYVVKRGDSLASIAERTGLTVSQLRKINNLRGSQINRGQKLKVSTPVKTSSTNSYRVRRGDSLRSIADKFGVTVASIRAQNRIKRDRVYPGQVLSLSTSASRRAM
jgi:membrane-bound lytic murein transglycosylase D